MGRRFIEEHSPFMEGDHFYVPVVRAAVYKALRPDRLITEEPRGALPVCRISLTGAEFIIKNDQAKNPGEVMLTGGTIRDGESAEEAACREVREESQHPTFLIGVDKPVRRAYSAFLPDASSQIHRDEQMVALYMYDLIPAVGANPADKIADTVLLSPNMVYNTIASNQLNQYTPLVTGLQYYPNNDEHPTHPNIDCAGHKVREFRDYIVDQGYWFETMNRLKVLKRLMLHNQDLVYQVDLQSLERVEKFLSLTTQMDSEENLVFLPYYHAREIHGDAIDELGGASQMFYELNALLDNFEDAVPDFRKLYLDEYNEMYFEELLTFDKHDIQKVFLDAMAFASLENRSDKTLEQFIQMNPYMADYIDLLATVLKIPNRGSDYFSQLRKALAQIQDTPGEYAKLSREMKTRQLFGSEDIYNGASGNAVYLIKQIHEHLHNSFRQLGETESQFDEKENLDEDLLSNDLPDLLQIFLTGKLRGEPVTPERQYQVIRHLILTEIATRNRETYVQKLMNRPEVLNSLSLMSPMMYAGGRLVRWRADTATKEYTSYLRKIIERTPPNKIYDVHRTTLVMDTTKDEPEVGIEGLTNIFMTIIRQYRGEGRKVHLQNIKGHEDMQSIFRYLETMYADDEGFTIEWEHEGSGAEYELHDVRWGKAVLLVDGVPMEIAVCASEEDYRLKKLDDSDFQLKRLFAAGGKKVKDRSRMSLVDILAYPLRKQMLKNFFDRAARLKAVKQAKLSN